MTEPDVDVIVVGAGPAGITASRDLAAAGLSVVVVERGQFPGAKNVSGGILYRQPTEEFCPGFEASAPLERPIIEQRYLALTPDSMIGGIYRKSTPAREQINAYSVLRSPFDRWYAETAEPFGVEIFSEFTVTDVVWDGGRVAGVTTGEADGELTARCVVLADGANSLLAGRCGLHSEWRPSEQALIAKELIHLDASVIEDRFSLPAGAGAAWELFGESTWGLLGYGFIYTNRESISMGTGVLLSGLMESGRNVNDMLDRFKRHPSIEPVLSGGETIEYSAHLIPESGWAERPQLYGDGVLVVGDAAGFVNPVHREGANLAMLSGRLAASTVVEAVNRDDFSAASLSVYESKIEESLIATDMQHAESLISFARSHPTFFADYPKLLSEIAEEYLEVDGRSASEKQVAMASKLKRVPKRQFVQDLLGAYRMIRS